MVMVVLWLCRRLLFGENIHLECSDEMGHCISNLLSKRFKGKTFIFILSLQHFYTFKIMKCVKHVALKMF